MGGGKRGKLARGRKMGEFFIETSRMEDKVRRIVDVVVVDREE